MLLDIAWLFQTKCVPKEQFKHIRLEIKVKQGPSGPLGKKSYVFSVSTSAEVCNTKAQPPEADTAQEALWWHDFLGNFSPRWPDEQNKQIFS